MKMRLIDADKLHYKKVWIENEDYDVKAAVVVFAKEIDKAPTVDAVPVRHGRWVDGHCSNCGCDVPAYIIDWKWQKDMDAKFCPQCGAKMGVGEQDE